MLFIAILNGAVREVWLMNYFGELRAHQVSSATGIVLLGVYIWVIIRNWRPESGALIEGEAKTFSEDQLEEALDWIKA